MYVTVTFFHCLQSLVYGRPAAFIVGRCLMPYFTFALVEWLGYFQQSWRCRVCFVDVITGYVHLFWVSPRLCAPGIREQIAECYFGYCGHFVGSTSLYFCFAFSPSFFGGLFCVGSLPGSIFLLVFSPFN